MLFIIIWVLVTLTSMGFYLFWIDDGKYIVRTVIISFLILLVFGCLYAFIVNSVSNANQNKSITILNEDNSIASIYSADSVFYMGDELMILRDSYVSSEYKRNIFKVDINSIRILESDKVSEPFVTNFYKKNLIGESLIFAEDLNVYILYVPSGTLDTYVKKLGLEEKHIVNYSPYPVEKLIRAMDTSAYKNISEILRD